MVSALTVRYGPRLLAAYTDTFHEAQALPRKVDYGKTEKRRATAEPPAARHGVMDCSANPSLDMRALPSRAMFSPHCQKWVSL